MKRGCLWIVGVLVVLGVLGCGQTAAPVAVPTVLATAVPTVALAAVVVAGTATPLPLATTVFVAESFVRAMFAKDTATMNRLYSTGDFADPDRDEYNLQLDGLTVKPQTAEEAGDKNPVTKYEYALAVATVSVKGKSGTYTYKIGTLVQGGRRVVNMVSRIANW